MKLLMSRNCLMNMVSLENPDGHESLCRIMTDQ